MAATHLRPIERQKSPPLSLADRRTRDRSRISDGRQWVMTSDEGESWQASGRGDHDTVNL